MSFAHRHPGTFLSTEAENGELESEIENRDYLARLHALLSRPDESPSDLLRSLLTLGAEWLDVEQGFLARVDLATKEHTITELSGPFPTISRDLTTDLCTTYCRKVVGEDGVLAVQNAEEEGWEEDPAFESFQFGTYLGTSVVVNGELYGTLCLVDDEPHPEPFDEGDAAVVKVLAESATEVLERRDTADDPTPTGPELSAVFEESPNMILFHDEGGTIHAPNPRLCEETGYDASELAGMKVWDLDQDVRPRVARRLWRRMDPGERSRWEGTYRRADGSTFPAEVDVKRLEVDGASRFLATVRDITERKEADRERREATQLLKQTLESLEEAVFVVDPSERKIIGCNSSVREVFGYEKDELMGESTEMLHTSREAYERFGEISEAVLDDEGVFRDEYQMRRKGGEIIDTEHVVTPLEDDNWPEGVVSVVRDVSQLKNQQRRFQAVFNQTYQFTGLLELDGTLIEANDAGLEFGGVDEEEVLGKRIWDTYWFQEEEDAQKWLRESMERAASGEFVRTQLQVRGTDETRTVDFSLRPIEDEVGDVAMIVAEGRDVTDRKETEQELRRERDLLNRILETSPAAIAVFNTEGDFVEASGRAEEILGLTKDEVTERTYNDPEWNIRGPDGGPFPDEELPFARVMNTGKPVHDVEHRIQWSDGTDRLLSVSGAPLRAPDGTLEGAVFHIEDITERRLAEKALDGTAMDGRRIAARVVAVVGRAVPGMATAGQVSAARRRIASSGVMSRFACRVRCPMVVGAAIPCPVVVGGLVSRYPAMPPRGSEPGPEHVSNEPDTGTVSTGLGCHRHDSGLPAPVRHFLSRPAVSAIRGHLGITGPATDRYGQAAQRPEPCALQPACRMAYVGDVQGTAAVGGRDRLRRRLGAGPRHCDMAIVAYRRGRVFGIDRNHGTRPPDDDDYGIGPAAGVPVIIFLPEGRLAGPRYHHGAFRPPTVRIDRRPGLCAQHYPFAADA